MNKHDSPTHRSGLPLDGAEPAGAILGSPDRPFQIRWRSPGPLLAPFVRHLWFTQWDLAAPRVQPILPLPAVNLVSEPGRFEATGVQTRRDDRVLSGRSRAYGINFLPAGFFPFVQRPMHTLTDARLDVAALLGITPEAVHAALRACPDDTGRAELLDRTLAPLAPRPDGLMHEVNALVEHARTDRSLLRAEQLAALAGVSLRTLQRRLRERVGVGPKALLRRFRLHEAAARLAEAPDTSIADLAYGLGYSDQAHFARDFAQTTGLAPSAYLDIQHPRR